MGAPSPWGSPPLGDPVLTLVRREACLGPQFVPLPRFIAGCSSQRAYRVQRPFIRLAMISLQVCCDRRYEHRWELGFNQSRFSLAYRTCGASRYIPSRSTAFPTCYFPLCVSTPGRLGVLEVTCSQPLRLLDGISTNAETAHTFTYVSSTRHESLVPLR